MIIMSILRIIDGKSTYNFKEVPSFLEQGPGVRLWAGKLSHRSNNPLYEYISLINHFPSRSQLYAYRAQRKQPPSCSASSVRPGSGLFSPTHTSWRRSQSRRSQSWRSQSRRSQSRRSQSRSHTRKRKVASWIASPPLRNQWRSQCHSSPNHRKSSIRSRSQGHWEAMPFIKNPVVIDGSSTPNKKIHSQVSRLLISHIYSSGKAGLFPNCIVPAVFPRAWRE